LELYQKIYVAPSFLESPHGEIACEECHKGNPKDSNWQTAHDNIVKDPTFPCADQVCGDCHSEIVESASKSLHYTLKPMFDTVLARSDKKNPNVQRVLKKSMEKHCSTCHSSCGQCHVSRPDYVKGGFLAKHHFKKTPPMDTTCASCHGGRVYGEFTGANEDFPADLHYADEEMNCMNCHKAIEFHADGTNVKNRYELPERPGCNQCHKDILSKNSKNRAHASHGQKLACQVCHAQAVKNCFSCHVGTDKKGRPYFKCDETKIEFKIGLNPYKSLKHPYEYIVLRHAPVVKDTFGFYAAHALTAFDSVPTWKPDTPHNLQRKTEQNKTCNNCHNNPNLFLQEKDLSKNEKTANKNVIVPLNRIPKRIEE
jgi:hypothetical protein